MRSGHGENGGGRGFAVLRAFAVKFAASWMKTARAKVRDPRRICPKILPGGAETGGRADSRFSAHLFEIPGGLGESVSKYSPWGGVFRKERMRAQIRTMPPRAG